ncbi:hypothetical protein ACFE04_015366 [Oxalis oulophora]
MPKPSSNLYVLLLPLNRRYSSSGILSDLDSQIRGDGSKDRDGSLGPIHKGLSLVVREGSPPPLHILDHTSESSNSELSGPKRKALSLVMEEGSVSIASRNKN